MKAERMDYFQQRGGERASSAIFSEAPPFPKILLEPTNFCNLACVFCQSNKSARKRVSIDFDFACQILRDAYLGGAREVGFYLGGESFLYPELGGLFAAARDIGYTYRYITTNGSLADKNSVAALIASGLNSIKFSINAGDAETYRTIHGKDYFNRVLKNLYDNIELRDKSIASGGCFYRVLASFAHMDELPSQETAQLAKRLEGVLDGVLVRKVREESGNTCPSIPFNSLNVTATGLLSLCCMDFRDELIVADLANQNIVDAWNNDVARSFRRKFIKMDLDGTLCGRCLYACADAVSPLVWQKSAPGA